MSKINGKDLIFFKLCFYDQETYYESMKEDYILKLMHEFCSFLHDFTFKFDS